MMIHLFHVNNFHLQLIISIILQLNLFLQLHNFTIESLYLQIHSTINFPLIRKLFE